MLPDRSLSYWKNGCDNHIAVLNLCKNITVHFAHQGAADVQSQAAAAVTTRIGAAPKAVEDVGQLVFAECAAAVADMDQLTIILPWKRNAYFPAIAVLDGIFDDVLQHFNASLQIAGENMVGKSVYSEVDFQQAELIGVKRLDFVD